MLRQSQQIGDAFFVKQINKSLVLAITRQHSPISRTKIAQITGLNKATVSALETYASALSNDIESLQAFHYVGEYLGIGISNIINVFNPSVIILGKDIIPAEKMILPIIDRVVTERTRIGSKDQVMIVTPSLGSNANIIGASCLVIENFFAGPCILSN